jgi:hypothetical protein
MLLSGVAPAPPPRAKGSSPSPCTSSRCDGYSSWLMGFVADAPPTWAVKFWSDFSAGPSVTDASEGTCTPWTSWPLIACVDVTRASRTNQPKQDVMTSRQQKNSRTRTKSGTGRTKAKNKTRHSPSKELARTADHVKKQSIKPHDQLPRPAANGSAGHDLNSISNSTSPPITVVGKQTDIVARRTAAAANGISDLRSANAGLMSFSPLGILLRQQELLTSVMLNVMQTQQHWARAFSRSSWRTA